MVESIFSSANRSVGETENAATSTGTEGSLDLDAVSQTPGRESQDASTSNGNPDDGVAALPHQRLLDTTKRNSGDTGEGREGNPAGSDQRVAPSNVSTREAAFETQVPESTASESGFPASEQKHELNPRVTESGATSNGSSNAVLEADPQALRTPREPWNNDYVIYGEPYRVLTSSLGYLEVGIASWYGKKFHGRKTSNGERFDMYQVSAAHKTLPIPTMVRVTNLDNGRKIDLRVNDRGPFHDDRIIDLSMAAARALGFSEQGTAPVVVEAMDALNYPDQFPEIDTEPSVYLQAGAFRSEDAALELVQMIGQSLPPELAEVGLRELASEATEFVLHKVWIGPIQDTELEQRVEQILNKLGITKPMRVLVD